MLKYMGYHGVVEYDSDGKIFMGEVIGIRSVVTFAGRTPEEIEGSFRQSIDLYLEMCKADGVSPEKVYSGRFTIRISPELHHSIAIQAAANQKSINDWAIEKFEKAMKS